MYTKIGTCAHRICSNSSSYGINFLEQKKRNLFRKAVKEWASIWFLLPVIRIEFNAYLFFALLLLWLRHTQPAQFRRKSPKHHPHLLFLTLKVLYISILHLLEFSSHLLYAHAPPFLQLLVLLLLLAVSVAWFYQHIVKGLWKIMMSLEKIFGIFMLLLLLL